MNASLRNLSVDERIRLVEELWASIAEDQNAPSLAPGQRVERTCRLDAYASDGNPGRPAEEVVADIRKRL